jgi:hypothetical protein
MKQVNIKVYEFSELSEQVQQKLIEKNRHILVQYDDWHDPIIEGFIEDMQELGHTVEYKNIQYSGFWSQGDGLSFTTDWGDIDTESVFKALSLSGDPTLVAMKLTRNSNYYSHEYTVGLETEGLISDSDFEIVEEYFHGLMGDLYRNLEKHWIESTSDKAVKEELIDLELQYFADGNQFVESRLITE